MVLSELTYMIRRTPAFAADRRVRTPLAQFAARSYVKPSPYGTVLIMSPWNYPLLLTLGPPDRCPGRRKHCGGQAQRILPATSRVIARLPGGVLSPGACLGGHRRQAGERLPAGAEVRLYLLHRQPGSGPGGPAPRRSVPHAGHPGAGRKEPLHRGRDCGSEADRPAHRLWKIPQLRPDLRGPRLSPLPGERQGRPAGGDRPADHCPVRPRPPGQPQLREDRQPEALPAPAEADPARKKWCAAAPGRRRPCASLPR